MSLWICSSKNILASGYQRRIYRYIRDMSDIKLHACTQVVLLRQKLERPQACVRKFIKDIEELGSNMGGRARITAHSMKFLSQCVNLRVSQAL